MSAEEEKKIIDNRTLFYEIIALLPEEIDEELICQKYVEYGGLINCKPETIKQFVTVASEKTKRMSNIDTRCFIATATLNNENHQVVVDLRDFRDQWLLRRKWGPSFVNWYYKSSPFYADKIRDSFLLRLLSYMVLVFPIYLIACLIQKIDRSMK